MPNKLWRLRSALRRKNRADYRFEKALIPGRKLLYVAVPKAASRSLLNFLLGERAKSELGQAFVEVRRLVFAARLWMNKGLAEALEACRSLPEGCQLNVFGPVMRDTDLYIG